MSTSKDRRNARWIALVMMATGIGVFFFGGGTSHLFPMLPYTSMVTYGSGLMLFGAGFVLAFLKRKRGKER